LPNSNASPAAVDFVTALGRLLQSGPLRDAFAADPQAVARDMGLRETDRAALVQLPTDDLEAQATVLLRKRFDLVKSLLPQTCATLGREAFSIFQSYARRTWPGGEHAAAADARGFCRALHVVSHPALSPLEQRRAEFFFAKTRWSLRWVLSRDGRQTPRRGLHLLLRRRGGKWSEWLFFIGW
jgi:hypothetical protein